MKYWNRKLQRKVEAPDIDSFLVAIDEVCKKYNMTISHEDGHGCFLILDYDGSCGIEALMDER